MVIYFFINKEIYIILVKDSNFALLISRKTLRKRDSSNENRNYKTYNSYKATRRKSFQYLIIKYQTKFLYIKPEKFILEEDKS